MDRDDDSLKPILEEWVDKYNTTAFIENDPVSIPHLFTKKQDIEIMGFFAATLAWGRRKSIINSCHKLIELFEGEPYRFILLHKEDDLKKMLRFVHRTFNSTDLLYFISFLKYHYSRYDSLEEAFTKHLKPEDEDMGNALAGFHRIFFSLPHVPSRSRKHIASPERNSACKRLNMFLRWMVRKDDRGVDFGLWHHIHTSQLLCPLDVHVERAAVNLGLLTRRQADWKATLELTKNLKKWDPVDPVKYDFALFNMGLEGMFHSE